MFLLDIEGVDSVAQNFTATLAIAFRWQDPDLTHDGPYPIRVPLDEIWHPNILILNQQNGTSTLPRSAEIRQDGEVLYRQRIWGDFSQPLKLRRFPFDSQRLEITLVYLGYDAEAVNLIVSEGSGISSRLMLPDWKITEWGFLADAALSIDDLLPQVKGAVFALNVKRDTSYFKYKVILPLVLIVMMSWLVFWIDPTLAASQISVAVTAMLTVIAYRFAIAGMMPKLAFLTTLDFFVLASTLVVFLSMVEVIYTAYLSTSGQADKARMVDRKARWIAPLIFVILSAEILYFRFLI